MPSLRKVLVTGANTGIGFALCKQLVKEHDCHVFLGSRSEERGREAVSDILAETPSASIELVVIDVANDESVKAAAASLAGTTFYAVVNNAGIGIAHGNPEDILNVNFTGVKRVVEAFLPMIDTQTGRIVGTSSGAASGYASGADWGKSTGVVPIADREPLSRFDVTMAQIMNIIEAEAAGGYGESEERKDSHHPAAVTAYCLSKAAMTAYHMILAAENQNLVVSTCSPGFIATKMTAGFGASLTPEQGTVSLLKCLFGDLGACKGWYYGSDGLRSPLNASRNPGEPEYEG